MQNIIRQTNDFLLQYKIRTLPLSINDLGAICKKLGYTLLSYQEAADALQKLKFESYTAYSAFTISTEDTKIVLFDSTLSTGTRIFSIAHEIGHIYLQHNYRGAVGFTDADSDQEREANAFSYQLVAPLCILRALGASTVREIQTETLLDRKRAKIVLKRLRTYEEQPRSDELIRAYGVRHIKRKTAWKTRIACLLAVVAMSIGLLVQHNKIAELEERLSTQSSAISAQSDLTTNAIVSDTATVYVTAGGERYHKENCYHIKNSTAKSLSRTAAESDGYTPCKTCYK